MTDPYYRDDTVTLHHGDALHVLQTLPGKSVDCCVTSPPYFGLRDYGVDGQYGAEMSPAEYVERLRVLFAEVRRVLSDDGTCWLNLGDSYNSGAGNQNAVNMRRDGTSDAKQRQAEAGGPKKRADATLTPKNLLGIPWRVAFALQDDGWILRNAIIWHKPNAMPESVTDRLSTRYELLFLLTRSQRYWFDLDPIREAVQENTHTGHVFGGANKAAALATGSSARRTGGTYTPTGAGRNPGDVWTIPTTPFPGAHFAAYPRELVRRCLTSGCKPAGTVLDPFHGSGTTGAAATILGHRYIGVDINAEYLDLSLQTRLHTGVLDFGAAT